jgi:hypothetical protein
MCLEMSNNKGVPNLKGDFIMKKNEPKSQNSFEFDEQGTIEVSNQITESYNSGFIGQGEEEPQSNIDSAVDDSGTIV